MEFLNDIKKRFKKEEEKQRKLKAQKGFTALLFANANDDQTKAKRKIVINGVNGPMKRQTGLDTTSAGGKSHGMVKSGSGGNLSGVAGVAESMARGMRGSLLIPSSNVSGHGHEGTDTVPPMSLQQKPIHRNHHNNKRKQIRNNRSTATALASVINATGVKAVGTAVVDGVKTMSRVLPSASTGGDHILLYSIISFSIVDILYLTDIN